MLQAVLFDLDDTLFDHLGCARTALEGVQLSHASLADVSFAELERTHARFLEELHLEVMAGRMGLDDARRERFRRVLAATGVDASAASADAVACAYRDGYQAARREVAGAAALLPLIKAKARVGVVSNNLREEQADKLRVCGLDRFVDVLVVSEEAGVLKPDPAIFHLALDRLHVSPQETVMVGDSWPADIVGARAAGIRPIWFNRSGDAPLDPAVPVLRTLEPADAVMRMIFDAHRD
jgi:HAD superfamily hydrolase (TIGR01549 family)